MCLEHLEEEWIELAVGAPAVVCCRCTPTQKADVVRLISAYTGLRTCAIGDGGNDVSMIQAAEVGVGIVGKVCGISVFRLVESLGRSADAVAVLHAETESALTDFVSLICLTLQEGKQASLAADFSITKFKHVARLFCMSSLAVDCEASTCARKPDLVSDLFELGASFHDSHTQTSRLRPRLPQCGMGATATSGHPTWRSL